MTHRWTISRWTAKGSKWGLKVLRRPTLRQSQVRLAPGRRRYTLMSVAYGNAKP